MKNIDLNYNRLCSDTYSINKVFREKEYDWPGDYEGRALLAFNCHYEISKKEIPCMHEMMNLLTEKTNSKLYFGKEFDGKIVDEQQLSGHNWYLRGLLKYADNFNSDLAMKAAKSTVENLYLKAINFIDHYPLERESYEGGVSGNSNNIINGWKLSTDIGCAFMCIDSLSKYYLKTKDERVKEFLDKYINFFITIDLSKYKFQTHTTLSCLRGILTLYEATNNSRYLDIVKDKYDYYIKHGMTLTYENFNWFNREDTWTEPCAIVDSFILAIELYKYTNNEYYKTMFRRIWFNGLQFCQRDNGGVGTNTCTTLINRILNPSMYEAYFCCTMRYSEGLLYASKIEDLLSWDKNKKEEVDELGRHFIDDKLNVMYDDEIVSIFSCSSFKEEELNKVKVKVIY